MRRRSVVVLPTFTVTLVCSIGAEAVELHPHAVVAGRQHRDVELSGLAGHRGAREPRASVFDGDGHPGKNSATRIFDEASNRTCSEVGLGPYR